MLGLTERRVTARRPFERLSRFCPVDSMPHLPFVLVGMFVVASPRLFGEEAVMTKPRGPRSRADFRTVPTFQDQRSDWLPIHYSLPRPAHSSYKYNATVRFWSVLSPRYHAVGL
jgi:hypothetical protein